MSSRTMVHCKHVPVIVCVSPAALYAAFGSYSNAQQGQEVCELNMPNEG